MKRYFIIGTDTDCGKTYVTCQLLDYFKHHHKRALAIKPVASGCLMQDGQLVSDDVRHLQRHNPVPHQQICQWLFKPPISPHLAAEQAGHYISAQDIVNYCNNPAFVNTDYLLIETAGGLMSPINNHETWLDVLVLSKIPVIFVVGMRLGCLNHALLTASALKTKNINCVGWIANCIDKDMLALPENIKTLTEKIKAPLLTTIAYAQGIEKFGELK
jgi:dethiobiotin synthetase